MSKFRVLNFKFKLYYFNFKKITLSNEMNNFVSQLLLATYITKNRKKEKKNHCLVEYIMEELVIILKVSYQFCKKLI